MQISRHWRLNSQRYRLQGVRYHDGKVSLQSRPVMVADSKLDATEANIESEHAKNTAVNAA